MTDKGTVRQLFKQIAGGSGLFVYSTGIIDSVTMSGEGWEHIPQPAALDIPVIACRKYIDMAGYTQDDLTFFTQSVDFQKDKAVAGVEVTAVYEYDLLTTRRITTEELSDMYNTAPAFLDSTLDLMECVYGQQTTWFVNQNILGGLVPITSDIFGSGNPSAADRLHWTKILIGVNAATPQVEAVSMGANQTNLVVGGLTVEEKDLVYIERLRRAYTQQRSES